MGAGRIVASWSARGELNNTPGRGRTGGGPLGYEAIQQQLRTLTRKAGLPASLLTAHGLRRACATHLLDHGASPLILKELLRHERAATLSHYLRQTITDVKATHSHTAPGR